MFSDLVSLCDQESSEFSSPACLLRKKNAWNWFFFSPYSFYQQRLCWKLYCSNAAMACSQLFVFKLIGCQRLAWWSGLRWWASGRRDFNSSEKIPFQAILTVLKRFLSILSLSLQWTLQIPTVSCLSKDAYSLSNRVQSNSLSILHSPFSNS